MYTCAAATRSTSAHRQLMTSERRGHPLLNLHREDVVVELGTYERERRRKDPKQPASDQALMRMV